MINYKKNKLIVILQEFKKDGNKYIINGVDESSAVFFARKPQSLFEPIPKGYYTITEELNNKYLNITDSTYLSQIEAIQIGKEFASTSSDYNVDFNVDINILKNKYNELVSDVKSLFGYVRKNLMIADALDVDVVLPQLDVDEVWVRTENGYRGLNIGSLEANVKQMIEELKQLGITLKKELNDLSDKLKLDISGAFDEEIKVGKEAITQTGNTEVGIITDLAEDKKTEITQHTDEEIKKIQATGIDNKFDKGGVLEDEYNTALKVQNKLKTTLMTVDTIEVLKATNLKQGDVIEVLGYYTKDDGASHKRVIAQNDDRSGVQLDNGLYANIVHNGEVNVSWFGAKGDGVTDDTEAIQKAFNCKAIVNGENKKYFLTKNIILKNSIKNFEIIVSKNNFVFTNTFPNMYSAVIVNSEKLNNIFLENIKCSCKFLGDENSYEDVSNAEKYASPTSAFINIMRSNNVRVSGCYIRGFETCSCVFDGTYNLIFENNDIGLSLYHGINIQGSETASTKNSVYRNNKVSNVGMMAFDSNTLKNEYSFFYNNKIHNASVISKTTNGNSVYSNNFIKCWDNEIRDDIGAVYGNSQHIIASNDIVIGASKLFASTNIDANNISWETDYCKTCVAILDNTNIVMKNMNFRVKHITEARQFITLSDSYKKGYFYLYLHANVFLFDTTSLTNVIKGYVLPSAAYFGKIDIQLDYFNHNALPEHRFNLSNEIEGLKLTNSYITSTGAKEQTYFSFKNCKNTKIYNNSFKNIAPLFYESKENMNKNNFIQYNNLSDIKSSIFIGQDNVKVVDYNSKRVLQTSTEGMENGSIYNNGGVVTIVGSEVQKLDTPYMSTKMQQEGVYEDFITYMDEKTLYDKQQEQLERDKQLAYEEELKVNPNLTYEEFLQNHSEHNLSTYSRRSRRSLMIENVEPQPSEALKKFMNKWL